MEFSQSRTYIESNPGFKLARASVPTLQRGQMAIVLDCLQKAHPNCLTLEELVSECGQKYRNRFRNPNTDIRKSIIYQLNRTNQIANMKLIVACS
jgi:predicted transcriptional regulator